jgi:hypothetical protein
MFLWARVWLRQGNRNTRLEVCLVESAPGEERMATR